MILFNNWKIEHIGGILARQYDNLSQTLVVSGVPDGWDWAMLVGSNGSFDKLLLSPMDSGVGVVLTKDMLALDGFYNLQLVGTLRADGVTVRHTNVITAFVSGSLSGDANWPTVPSEFTQLEQRIRELNSHPPTIGDHGYWLIWNPDQDVYEESEFPLPEGGGCYTPSVTQPNAGTMRVSYSASAETMPEVSPVDITLPAGPQGPKGADGHTPVRGTDYWTAKDQQVIVGAVLAALPDGDEVSY